MIDFWYDAVDVKPKIFCEFVMKDGSIIEGLYIMGSFEDMEGRAIYPEKFRVKEVMYVIPLGNSPLDSLLK